MYFNGTKSCALLLSCALSFSAGAKDVKTLNAQGLQKPLCFVENKGQVKDQDNNPRNDIQYKLSSPGMNLYVGNGQLHYQFQKTEGGASSADAKMTSYRMDVTLVGANSNAKVISAEEQAYYENYFLGNGGNEALTVHSFDKIVYKDVYPGIDWMLYVKNNKVEYDFVVRPGGDIHDIQLKYEGTTALNISKDGGLSAETPLGNVKEKSPYSYETATGKLVASNFVVHNNIVSFEAGAHTGSLTIDPTLQWSTYFGGSAEDVATSVKETTSGITFVGGYTASTTVGFGPALHTSYLTGAYDGFLAKYSAAGVLMFTTYFGGTSSDRVTAIALDNTGAGNPNVFIAGTTNSLFLGAIPVVAYHAGTDGFVAKLNNAGTTLTWNTYYGGTGNDNINAIVCDASNNIYITGRTASPASISTGGTFQTSLSGINDAFVAKLSGSAGSVTWGTYYGGSAQEEGFGIALDASNNVFIAGQTNSIINIATTGAHQTILSGTNDAFIGKLNSTGTTRAWGTYFGGSGEDQGNGIAVDQTTGSFALVGSTSSANNIVSTRGYQQTYGGGLQDAFAAYFTSAGARTWGTYLGGNQPDYGQTVCIDNSRNIVIAGASFSSSGISSSFNASQPAIGGDYDAFVSKFNILGQNIWSSYFGGLYYDYINSVTVDNNNQIVVAGYTTSSPASGIYGSDGIATVGAAKTTFSGGVYDAFVTKFNLEPLALLDIPFTENLVCAGGTYAVNYTTNTNFTLGNVFSVQMSDVFGNFGSPVTIGSVAAVSSGTVTCTIPAVAPATGYRIRLVASSPAFVSPDNYTDIQVVSSLPPTTASGITPVCVGGVISLFDNATYSVNKYSWSGPAGSGFGGLGFTSTVQNPFNNGVAGTGITKADSGIYTVITSHNGCPDMSASVNIVVNDVIPPTPIVSSSILNCAGNTINLFANPDTTGAPIKYDWSGPAGFTSTLQNPTRADAEIIFSGIYTVTDYLEGCPSATQTVSVTVTDTTHVTVNIKVSPYDTICKGTMVTFTATPVNGGAVPSYQWMTGSGAPIVGAISDVFSSNTLVDGEKIFVVLHSSLICPAPEYAVSNVIKMNVISNPPIVKIFSDATHVKKGDSILFTSAVYNEGTSPLYQWKKNGVDIPEANDDYYILHNVIGTETITLQLTSTMMCSVPNYGISNAIIVGSNVGVRNVTTSLDNIELFPNPNSGSFSIKGNYNNTASALNIEIINVVGQVVHTTTATVQNNLVDKSVSMKGIADGVYLMRLSDGEQTKTIRFTVSR